MPYATPRPCTYPGCVNTITTKKARCDLHPYADPTAKQRQVKRGLPTNHPRWRRIRALQLQREPLCRTCNKAGVIASARHVDHIDGDSTNNYRDNLQSLCVPCHSRKTALEDGGFGYEKPTDN